MKIPVLFRIHSVIRSEGDPSPFVTTRHTEGEMEYSDGRITLVYSEKTEGGEQITRLTVEDECVRLSLGGASASKLYFREGAEYDTIYSVGGFSFDAHVKSEPPRVKLNERGGEIRLGYEMNLGGDPRQARLHISVKPKE